MSLQSSNFDRLSTHLTGYLFVHHVDVVVELHNTSTVRVARLGADLLFPSWPMTWPPVLETELGLLCSPVLPWDLKTGGQQVEA